MQVINESQRQKMQTLEPTEKQLQLLKKLGYELTADDEVLLSRYRASQMIEDLLSKADAERQVKTYLKNKYQDLANTLQCPLCYHGMVVRSKRAEVFFGCEYYPQCKGMLTLREAQS